MSDIPLNYTTKKELYLLFRRGFLANNGQLTQQEKDEEYIDDDDEYWEKRLPHNYPRLTEMSDIPLNYTTKKELYLLFRRGFLANNGQLSDEIHIDLHIVIDLKKPSKPFIYD
nr:protein kinase-like domain, phloem protein 2-like protein [Tanacetum cinerariifolium]